MRVEGKCIGDCSKCQLLANGEVDMIPCILDQIFIRTRKIDKENAFIRRSLDSMMQDRNTIQLAGLSDNEDKTD